jgi:hypothetical protein
MRLSLPGFSVLAALIASTVVACERAETSGNPFAPVEPEKPSTTPVSPGSAGGEEWAFPTGKPFEISSDQMGKGGRPVNLGEATGAVQAGLAPAPSAPSAPGAGQLPAGASPGAQAVPPPAENVRMANLAPVNASIPFEGWPIRLVGTVPGAQPPRAILGLPDGKEVVVTPGTLVPDLGVVVLAIGNNTAEIAEIRPAGDHASVKARTLQSLK